MAKFNAELPTELIKEFEKLEVNSEKIIGEMAKSGAEIVYNNIKNNMRKSFKTTNSLEKGLKMTKIYKTSSDEIGVYVGFYGYDPSKKTKRYPNGVPIPLIAMAREYGTSRGEAKKPFVKNSIKKKEIEQAMLKVQDKYIKGD